MRKEGVFVSLFILALIILPLISAADNSSNATYVNQLTDPADSSIDKAYSCLNNQLNNKTSVSLQEATFGSMALGSQSLLDDKITAERNPNFACWPKSGCTIKDTAQVLLAYNREGTNTQDIEDWLMSKNVSLTDLNWYLEVDISKHVPSVCTIKYDKTSRSIRIGEDMKLTADSDLGSCLNITDSGNWMQISSSCYQKSFDISCDQDFVTTLLYTKTASPDVTYVSSSTSSAPSSGTTTEKINARCLKSSTSNCDYEGNLWAALALQKTGNDVSSYIPYLMAIASDNEKYAPYTFLYMISSGADDQYNKIISSQKQNQFWEAPSTSYNKYYDTALAMLAISGSGAAQLDNAKNYLLAIQSPQGCWNNNNFKDTAFLLYSGWPKSVSGGSSGSSHLITSPCEVTGSTRSCEYSYSCAQAGGNVLTDFTCDGAKSCCSVKVQQQTCQDKGGKICMANEQCSGSTVPASDGSCCQGTCSVIQMSDTCTVQSGGACKNSCSSSETRVTTATCTSSGQVCCKANASTGFSWLTWLLILLIIIVALAIYYRNELMIYWFKFQASQKAKTPPPSRPGQSPQRFAPTNTPMPRPQQTQRPQSPPPIKSISSKDKDLEETLRKLKEMSK